MINRFGAKIQTQRLCQVYKMVDLDEFKKYCRDTISKKPEYLNVIVDGLTQAYWLEKRYSEQGAAEILKLIMSLKLQTMFMDKEIDFVEKLEEEHYFFKFYNREEGEM